MFSFSQRAKAVVLLLGIFALGLVCGVIAERRLLRAPAPRGRPYSQGVVERLGRDLALSDVQKKAIQRAFQDNRREIDAMRRRIGEDMRLQEQKLREQFEGILTPEQFEKFEKRNRRRGFRGRGGGRRGPPPDHPPGPRRGP